MKNILFFVLLLCSLSLSAADTSISVLGEIDEELNQVNSALVKELLKKKVTQAWSIKDEEEKVTELKSILEELRKLNKDQKPDKVDKGVSIQKEIALCNYLIQQACLLEAMDGRGVGVVRKELTGNFNNHGLSKEGSRLLRRLIELCNEAERSYSNVNYVESDGSEAKAELLTSNIGAGVGISLALGDVTPLISAAVRIGRGYNNINKTKSRQLTTLIQAHKARITNFLFNINSRKNDLLAEHNVAKNLIITPEVYRDFLKVLIEKDDTKRHKGLLKISKDYPGFEAPRFYLGSVNLEMGQIAKARGYYDDIIKDRNPLLHKDGFLGESYTSLSKIDLEEKKHELGIKHADMALKENSANGKAYSLRAFHKLALKQNDDAWEDIQMAVKTAPKNHRFCVEAAKIAAVTNKKLALDLIDKAVDLGFRDVASLYEWKPLKELLDSPKGKIIITPDVRAVYKAGLIKDDIILVNKSRFILDDFKAFIEVKYLKKNVWKNLQLAAAKTKFEKDATVIFKNKFSMPKDSKCKISITYKSKQNPDEITVVIVYNHDGNQKHKFDWEVDAQEAWQDIIKSDDKDVLKAAIEKLKKAAEKSLHKNSEILSGMAHAWHKLGVKDKAVEMQKEAMDVLKNKLPDKLYDISVIPYKNALEKFEQFKEKFE